MDEPIKKINTEGRDPVTGRFIEGNSGKPKGARQLTTLVKEALTRIAKNEGGEEIKYEEALIRKILHKAIVEGDTAMIKLMWNYIDGMPTQFIEVETTGEEDRHTLKNIAEQLKHLKDETGNSQTNNP